MVTMTRRLPLAPCIHSSFSYSIAYSSTATSALMSDSGLRTHAPCTPMISTAFFPRPRYFARPFAKFFSTYFVRSSHAIWAASLNSDLYVVPGGSGGGGDGDGGGGEGGGGDGIGGGGDGIGGGGEGGGGGDGGGDGGGGGAFADPRTARRRRRRRGRRGRRR